MHWQQTPDTFLPGLRSLPWWDNDDIPLTKVLEENQAKLRKDAEKLLKRRRGGWDETYSSLIADGDWRKLSLCTAAPPDQARMFLGAQCSKQTCCELFVDGIDGCARLFLRGSVC